MTTLVHALRAACGRDPGRTALTHPQGDVTYGELLRRAERLAVGFGVLGVEPGDRVACGLQPARAADRRGGDVGAWRHARLRRPRRFVARPGDDPGAHGRPRAGIRAAPRGRGPAGGRARAAGDAAGAPR